jgi:starch synthase (maltosyl-transferring)
MSGPRIYNLFPPLIGTVRQWEKHLPRIAGMRFNWVFLNPLHQPGWSGSLYAVKDYYQLNPLFQGDSRERPEDLLTGFLKRAGEHGLSIMMDLVINHTSKDSPLVAEHPDWYHHNEDGSVHSPGAEDANAPGGRVVWGDLAEINYESESSRPALLNYWKDLVRHYTRLGFQGFRCDAAYQVPGEAWKEIITAGREINPKVRFFAETLGAQPEQITQLGSAGFDYFFNSAKWWDFHESWLLEQYEQFRHIAPSIAFPESHDTRRLADETGGDERQSRLRYLFAAFFSSGVMMPVGYEFGFRKKLHVVKTRPEHWEKPSFDLSSFIAAANQMKEQAPVLNEEGPQERLTPPEDTLVVLLRRSDRSPERAVALINADRKKPRDYPVADLERALEAKGEAIKDITPAAAEGPAPGETIPIPPSSMRVFHRS